MKKILTIILIFCVFITIGCKRESVVDPPEVQVLQVSGDQSGTWSGEVHLIGDVVVPEGETLNISAGTKVISDGYFEIHVLGNLSAIGMANSRITFTVADTTGYSNSYEASAGAWKGFYFHKPGNVVLRYCDFSYGKSDINIDGGVMRISRAEGMEITSCRFHHNTTRHKGGALFAENSVLTINDCEVYKNSAVANPPDYTWGVGFQFLKCDIDMHYMVFHDNYSETAYGGGMNIDSCNMTMDKAAFYNNKVVNAGGFGIQRCKDYTVKVANVLAYNNWVMHYGGALAVATSDPELNNLTIVGNYCGGGGGAGMQMAFNACPALNNCIFWGNRAISSVDGKATTDTIDYYMGSQIWLWGDDCYPKFNNGVVQYGLDSIHAHEHILPENYNEMLDTDPMFVDMQHRNYRLQSSSPCINTGVANITGLFIPITDFAENPRIFGGRIDMGCYEWQGNK